MTNSSPGTELTVDELREALGEKAAAWPSLGIRATRHDSGIRVWWDAELLGYTEPSAEFPGSVQYRAVATVVDGHPYSVRMPVGYMPTDPVWVAHSERRRWLPPDHSDYPRREAPLPGCEVAGPRDTAFWAQYRAVGPDGR